MNALLKNVKIAGVLAVVPPQAHRFEDELRNFPFPEKSSRRLGEVMGFDEHRIAPVGVTHCDLAACALRHLLSEQLIDPAEVDELIFVSQSREYPVPGNSKILHGRLSLPGRIHCVDLYENCTGFVAGLYAAACAIACGAVRSVLLVNAEAGACYANPLDRNTYPLCGDAAAVTLITHSDDDNDRMRFTFRHDTALRETLLVPAGGLRLPCSAETAQMTRDPSGNVRSKNQLHMDGTAVFHYVMETIPPLIEELLGAAGIGKNDVAYFLTHQPNRFMLEKLADLMAVPRERLFNNIVGRFGNSSGVTIPLNIAFNLGERLFSEHLPVCLAAFGGGMSAAAALCDLGELSFCSLVEYTGPAPGSQAIH